MSSTFRATEKGSFVRKGVSLSGHSPAGAQCVAHGLDTAPTGPENHMPSCSVQPAQRHTEALDTLLGALLLPSYRGGNRGPKQLEHSPMVTQR